jgi:nucleoside-diphosphate-sugar epimerase
MIKPRIIVTGATGKTGSVVVTELLKAGYPVRAMVRRKDGRSARLRAQGAEVPADHKTTQPLRPHHGRLHSYRYSCFTSWT